MPPKTTAPDEAAAQIPQMIAIIEPIVAVAAIVILYVLLVICDAFTDDAFGMKVFFGIVFGAAGLYFLVRIIHWAWVTPIPFLDKL